MVVVTLVSNRWVLKEYKLLSGLIKQGHDKKLAKEIRIATKMLRKRIESLPKGSCQRKRVSKTVCDVYEATLLSVGDNIFIFDEKSVKRAIVALFAICDKKSLNATCVASIQNK